jgi:hypothetical protein
MTSQETITNLSTAFHQLSDALHSASVVCKGLEYLVPQLAASTTVVTTGITSNSQPQLQTQLGKAKHVRDPNEPRRPPSPYLLFTSKVRASLVKSNPDLRATEIITELGGLWSNLTDDQKQVLGLSIPTFNLMDYTDDSHMNRKLSD